MSVNHSLTIYEPWEIYPLDIPSRSRLFPLKPIGIGTPYVESLTSYLTRLAEAHTVLVGVLVLEEIKSVISKQYKSRDLFCIKQYTGAINGTGVIANDLAQALEQLTLRQDLTLLTLLKWSQVFPKRQLTRSVKTWCPKCYQDWLSQNRVIYDPLLWSFDLVNICSIHKIYLQTRCPHCLPELTPLATNSRPGYCSNCRQWLGQNNISDISIIEDQRWQTYG